MSAHSAAEGVAGHDLLAHSGDAGGGSVLPGVLLLVLLAAVTLLVAAGGRRWPLATGEPHARPERRS